MRIQRVLNNNVVVAHDFSGKECVVIGKGVGFNKKPNDLVDEAGIQKIFRLDEENSFDKTHDAFQDLPEELFDIVLDIVKQATTKLDRKRFIRVFTLHCWIILVLLLNERSKGSMLEICYFGISNVSTGMSLLLAFLH
ncbi:CAT RNA binding domain-containing protein [Yersinia enterocolitica]|uniref:CAT RNA binding domain-containing protein n=1 Tax=Yersinia enterocolitica TaxID=630 RepID=UPI001E48CC7E|nr:CAT RNA binding domain-containing protein [Yersinia enterocolitica]